MLASLDTPDQALAELRRAYEASGAGDPNQRRNIGLWAGYFGNPVLAFTAMRAAIDEQGGLAAYLWLPQLAEMRRLPEFKAYMREIGMVAYWQKYDWPRRFCRPLNGARLRVRLDRRPSRARDGRFVLLRMCAHDPAAIALPVRGSTRHASQG